MQFSEKLLRLMLLENVSNIKLARSINVDPSLISRWKKGERVPADDSEHLSALSAFFAEGARAEYQIRQIFELTNNAFTINQKPTTQFLQSAIYEWLCAHGDSQAMVMDSFIRHLSGIACGSGGEPSYGSGFRPSSGAYAGGGEKVFLGAEGRRAAVLTLMSLIERFDKHGEIFLFSDENLDWLTGDPGFYQEFLTVFRRLVANGVTLKLLYPYRHGRENFPDFIEAWLPFYVSGGVEQFYCSKYRDNIFQQFLMVAPEAGAILSHGVAGSRSCPSLLITDAAGINAIRAEFDALLGLCVPGMSICQSQDAIFTAEKMKDYWSSMGSIFYVGSVLPMVTAPGDFAYDVVSFGQLDGKVAPAMVSALKDRADRFIRSLRENTCVAMAPLSKPEDILAGRVTVSNSRMFFGQPVKYTPRSYVTHLEHLAGIISKYPNYRFQVIDDWDTNLLIMAKLGAGSIISKTSQPPITFFTEYDIYPEITDSLYDYLEGIYEKIPADKRSRKYNLDRIESLIKELRQSL